MDEPEYREYRDLIACNRKIEAIKLYRERYGVGLREAKNAIDAMAAGRAAPSRQRLSETRNSSHRPVEDPEMLRQIEEFIRAGKKMDAIKLYRSLNGGGLKETKDVIDAWAVRLGLGYPDSNRLAMRILKAWAVRIIARYCRPSR